VCGIDYENQQHNNVGVGNGKPSVSVYWLMKKRRRTMEHKNILLCSLLFYYYEFNIFSHYNEMMNIE
jgi:hypothetical protein